MSFLLIWMVTHSVRSVSLSRNRSIVCESKRVIRRDLRAPPIQHVYPRNGRNRQHPSIEMTTTTTTVKPQLCNCTQAIAPVCGSNGDTFTNQCFFNCAAKDDASLRMLANGIICSNIIEANERQAGAGATNPLQVSQSHAHCACPEMFNPICASNDKTYSNVCEFTCEKRKQPSIRLRIMHRGECTSRRMPTTRASSVNAEHLHHVNHTY